MYSSRKVVVGLGLLAVVLACVTSTEAALKPPGFLEDILEFADSNVATKLISAGLGIRPKGSCTTPYPAHNQCPQKTYPPSGTRWPRRIEAVAYLGGTIQPIPFTDALDDYVIKALNSLSSNNGIKPLEKCINRTVDWLCTYIHGSLSYSSECVSPQKIEDYMPCKDHCVALVRDCLDGGIDLALKELLGVAVDMTIQTGNPLIDIALGIAIRLIPLKGELLGIPSEAICNELGDLGANCNHIPDGGSVVGPNANRSGEVGPDTWLWVIIAIGILVAIGGGLFMGAAIRKRNQDEVLDAYKSMETSANDAWAGMSAKTASAAAPYKSGYTSGGRSAKTASNAVPYKSGFTGGPRGSAVTAPPATPYRSGHTTGRSRSSGGSRSASKSNASRGTRSASSGSKGRSTSNASKGSRGRSTSGSKAGRSSSTGSKGRTSSGSKGRKH